MKLTKRILSVVLSVLMLASMIPCFEITATAALWDRSTLFNNGYAEPNNTRWNSAQIDEANGHVVIYYKNGKFYTEPDCAHLCTMIGTWLTLEHGTGSYDVWKNPSYANCDFQNCTFERFFNGLKWYNKWCHDNNVKTHKIKSVEIVMFSPYTSTNNEMWGNNNPDTYSPLSDLVMNSPAWYESSQFDIMITRGAKTLFDAKGQPNSPMIIVDHSGAVGPDTPSSAGLHLSIGYGVTINNNLTDNTQADNAAISVRNYSLLMMQGGKITNGNAATNGVGYGVIVDGSSSNVNKAGACELFYETTIEKCYAGVYQKTGITRFKEPCGNGYDLTRNVVGILMGDRTFIGKWTADISSITGNNVKIALEHPANWQAGDILMTSGYEWEYNWTGSGPANGGAITKYVQVLHYRWCDPADVNSLNFVDGANPDAKLSIEWKANENSDTPPMENNLIIGWNWKDSQDQNHSVGGSSGDIYPVLLLAGTYIPTETEKLKLDYDSQGGTPANFSSEEVTITKGGAHEFDISTTIPTKSGWHFLGWKDYLYSATHPVIYTAPGKYTASAAHHLLEAVWSATLSYDANGGTGAPASETYRDAIGAGYVSNIEVGAAPSKSGATFHGWSDGNGHVYQPGELITIYGDTTLTALWETPNSAYLHYDPNADGDTVTNMPGTQSTQIVNGNATFTISSTVPQREHYVFMGWYEDLSGGHVYEGGDPFTFQPVAADDYWTMYAVWVPMTYTVTYNDGVPSATIFNDDVHQNCTYNTATPAFVGGTPTRTGYTFAGWSTTLGGPVTGVAATVTGNVTYYAVWTANTYTVTYTDNVAGETVFADESYTRGYGATTPAFSGSTSRTGWTFTGWNTKPDGSGSGVAATVTDNVTYYAQWTQNTYTVIYNDGVTTETVFSDDTHGGLHYNDNTPGFVGGTPTRTGYTFAGWGKSVNGGVTGVDAKVTKNITYYAQWTINNYTVTYTDNVAGETVFADQSYTRSYGAATPAFSGTPTRAGYDFAGWNTMPDGSGSGVAATVTASVTYYAQWTLKTYTVTYTDNVADKEVFPDQVYNNCTHGSTTPSFNGTVPDRAAYVFAGWNTKPDGTGSGVAATVTGDVTYYAQWTLKTYTVTYTDNVAGETVFEDQTTSNCLHGSATPGFDGTPTRTGWTFTGWNTKPDGSGSGVSATVTADVTYYAQWTVQLFNVKYMDNVDDVVLFPHQRYNDLPYGTPTPEFVGTPTRPGYEFIGWNTKSDGSGVGPDEIVTRNRDYYAQWRPLTYTVTYTDNVAAEELFADQVTENLLYNADTPAFIGTPTRTGYRFLGWSTSSTGTVAPVAATVTADATYYAQWEEIADVILTYDFGKTNMYTVSDLLLPSEKGRKSMTLVYGELPECIEQGGTNLSELYYTPTGANVGITFQVKTTFTDVTPNEEIIRTVRLLPASNVYYEAESFAAINGTKSQWSVQDGSDFVGGYTVTDNLSTVYGFTTTGIYANIIGTFSGNKSLMTTLVLPSNKSFVRTDDYLTFTFTGTGFDIISACGDNTAMMMVYVKDSTGKTIKASLIDTYFVDETIGLDYQVPVVRFTDLDYDTYEVSIYGWINRTCGAVAQGGLSTAYVHVDGFRVYGALDEYYLDEENTVKAEASYAANEQAVKYVSIYDFLKGSSSLVGDQYEEYDMNTVLYMEGSLGNGVADIADYKVMGPENEVYLFNQNGVASGIGMVLVGYHPGIDTIMVSARAVTKDAKLAVMDDEVFWNNVSDEFAISSTEMYYDVTPYVFYDADVEGYILILGNIGDDSVLSISTIKLSTHIEFQTPENLAEHIPEKQEAEFTPDSFTVSYKETVISGRSATISIKTSLDVDHIVIKDGDTVIATLNPTNTAAVNKGKSSQYSFTYTIKDITADVSYQAYAADAEDKLSDAAKIEIAVQ